MRGSSSSASNSNQYNKTDKPRPNARTSCSQLPELHPRSLLSLVSNPNRLATLPHRHPRGSLLGTDSARLVLVLDERNSLSARHQSDLLESLEASKNSSKTLLVRRVGEVPQEQNLVGREILVRDDSRRRTAGGLETSSLGGFGRTRRVGGAGGTLELLLSFESLVSLFALCLPH